MGSGMVLRRSRNDRAQRLHRVWRICRQRLGLRCLLQCRPPLGRYLVPCLRTPGRSWPRPILPHRPVTRRPIPIPPGTLVELPRHRRLCRISSDSLPVCQTARQRLAFPAVGTRMVACSWGLGRQPGPLPARADSPPLDAALEHRSRSRLRFRAGVTANLDAKPT